MPAPDLDGANMRIAIVVARFNDHITSRLLAGAEAAAASRGVAETAVHWVPGAFELPAAAMKLAQSRRWDAVVCLGAVIRHETDHYRYVAEEAASGIARAGLETGVPCLFGVLTCDTEQQALERSQPEGRNAGRDAMEAAVQMANLFRAI